MKKTFTIVSLLLCSAITVHAQVSVTAPSGGVNSVASADEYATEAFQDPWDMSQYTDLGAFLYGVDLPLPGLTNLSFAGGILSGQSDSNGDPNVYLLESGTPVSVPLGKIGTNFPIDANRFRYLVVRMKLDRPSTAQLIWSRNTMFDDMTVASGIVVNPGWRVYVVDITTLPLFQVSGPITPWGGLIRSLRFDPTILANESIAIDWVRLVSHNSALFRTISWSGSGSVDVYLDNNNTPTNDPNNTLGLIAQGVSGGSLPFYVGALAPGDYYVAIRPSGSNVNFSYSPGFYRVNGTPTLRFTSPSEEGSSDDFADTQLGNAWDMNSMVDMDHLLSVDSPGISVFTAESEAGVPLGTVTAFTGVSASPTTGTPGDPIAYPFFFFERGLNHRIDPNRYRILTAELGIPNKARDVLHGSVVRIIWHVAGEGSLENVSEDIIINHRAGANVVHRMILDMKTLQLEGDIGGSPSTTGWNPGASPSPGIDSFRIDPHEFSDPTAFFIKKVRLAALERANDSYTIRWQYSESSGTVSLYYDDDGQGFDGFSIPGASNLNATTGSFTWNTAMPNGTYYIYAIYSDGLNQNRVYAPWPIVVDDQFTQQPKIKLNRSILNYGVKNSNQPSQQQTSGQTVRISVDGTGSPCWNVTTDSPWFLNISPASGCGSGTFNVSLKVPSTPPFPVGTIGGTVKVTAAGASNSPQFLQFWVHTSAGATSPPFGVIDTPLEGVAVTGSVPVTGWVLDDIEVSRVTICREAVSGESASFQSLCGGTLIYIGDAVLLDDARPDVEAASPNTPRNYRAGWGFMVLTNMLPGQGNGSYRLHVRAFDVEGQSTLLGTRNLIGQNATAIEPFGAIDTPGQGDTISGSNYVSFGWALAAPPKTIPLNGSTITVYIDGVPVGNPNYGHFRSDIATLFSNIPNADKAVGYFQIDTTAYANGVHTISWAVTDSAGVSTGIGSRFFTIFNSGSQ